MACDHSASGVEGVYIHQFSSYCWWALLLSAAILRVAIFSFHGRSEKARRVREQNNIHDHAKLYLTI